MSCGAAALSASTQRARLPSLLAGKTDVNGRLAETCGVGRVPRSDRARDRGPGNSSTSLEAVLGDLPGERIAMNPEDFCGLAEVSIGLREDVGDELLLELPLRVGIAHALRNHRVN